MTGAGPCLPTSAHQPPSGAQWVHEIKHDGFRVVARKEGTRVRLYSRPGTAPIPTDRPSSAAANVPEATRVDRSASANGSAAATGEDIEESERNTEGSAKHSSEKEDRNAAPKFAHGSLFRVWR